MDQNEIQRYADKKNSRIWSGVILVIAGILLLAYKIGAPIPSWIFSWPVLLILIGLLTGIKSGFHNAGSFIMIIIGGVFLVDKIVPGLNFHNYILPALLIGVGFIYILRPKQSYSRRPKLNDPIERGLPTGYSTNEDYSTNLIKSNSPDNEEDSAEYVDISAVFGGIKKIILSKNFKGGSINSFMGGTELNLLQADIKRPVILVVNNIFGGTKLIVPSNWDVKNELSAMFGGIEDKRGLNTGAPDPGKTLLLKGSCVFGGIEVTNY